MTTGRRYTDRRAVTHGGIRSRDWFGGMGRETPRRRFGFTLVELIAALAIFSVIVGVLGTTLFVAQRGTETLGKKTVSISLARQLLDRVADDLARTVGISIQTDTLIQFEIPDEDGDRFPEIVRYRWSLEPGRDVTRQVNNAAPVVVARNVRQFRIEARRVPTPPSGGTREVVLRQHLGYPPSFGSYEIQSVILTDSRFAAQALTFADVPASGQITISRVRFRARRVSPVANGELHVALREASGVTAQPNGRVLADRAIDLSRLDETAFEWVTVTFDVTLPVAPGDRLFIVFRGPPAGGCELEFDHLLAANGPDDQTFGLWTNNGGTTWFPSLASTDDYDGKIVVLSRLGSTEPLAGGMAELREVRTAGVTVDYTVAEGDELYREVLLSAAGVTP